MQSALLLLNTTLARPPGQASTVLSSHLSLPPWVQMLDEAGCEVLRRCTSTTQPCSLAPLLSPLHTPTLVISAPPLLSAAGAETHPSLRADHHPTPTRKRRPNHIANSTYTR